MFLLSYSLRLVLSGTRPNRPVNDETPRRRGAGAYSSTRAGHPARAAPALAELLGHMRACDDQRSSGGSPQEYATVRPAAKSVAGRPDRPTPPRPTQACQAAAEQTSGAGSSSLTAHASANARSDSMPSASA